MGTRGKLRMCQFKQPPRYIHTHMALTDKSVGEPPPPKDFDINISNKPNVYSPQCPKTYKNV
jgi:hypothetical protein